MKRICTCKKCGSNVLNNKQKIDGNYYCEICFKKIINEKEQHKTLINLIKEISLKLNENINGIVYGQIKDYKENYGYTYGGMKYTLWYLVYVLGRDIKLDFYGISCIKSEYNNALNFYKSQKEVANSVKKDNILEKTTSSFVEIKPNVQKIGFDMIELL